MPSPPVRLRDDHIAALQRLAPSIDIAPARDLPGAFQLTPASTIGSISCGDLKVVISPKLPIKRILFLVSYGLGLMRWKDIGFDFEEAGSIVDAIVPGFLKQVREAVARGLLHGYRPTEEALATLRGRIRIDEQIRRRYGVAPPLEVRYDDFTSDIEENRILKAALRRVGRMNLRMEGLRAEVAMMERVFGAVATVEYERVPRTSYTRLNKHYRSAIGLAEVILRNASIEIAHGRIQSTSFLVDMNDVFETFVSVALREALRVSERTLCRGKGIFLDEDRSVMMRPDMSWWEGGECKFVGDIKYKRFSDSRRQEADLYQLLAYVVATNLAGGLLIYAAGPENPVAHKVLHVGRMLELFGLNLEQEPECILARIQEFAGRIRELKSCRVEAGVAGSCCRDPGSCCGLPGRGFSSWVVS